MSEWERKLICVDSCHFQRPKSAEEIFSDTRLVESRTFSRFK